MMNNDSNGIENTQNTETQVIEASVEQTAQPTQAEAEYEAAFAAELAAEEITTTPHLEEMRTMLEKHIEENGDGPVEIGETLEQAALAVSDVGPIGDGPSTEVTEVQTDAVQEEVIEETKEKPVPAYLAFIAATNAHATALGLSVKEQKGFFQYSAGNGHKLYVAKQGKGVSRVDTTLPRTALVVNGKDLGIPLSKPNGRITAHIDPTVESVTAVLDVLASYSDKIPAPRKPAKAV